MRRFLQRLREQVRGMLRAHLEPADVGFAVGIGAFIGALPIYGLHLPVCVVTARRFGLNQAVVYGAANISNPFFAPFLIAAEITVGRWMLGIQHAPPADAEARPIWEWLRRAPDLLAACTLGSVVIGALLGVVLGFGAWWVARWRKQRRRAQ